MNVERVREQLKLDEGVEYKIYLDHLGYATCGIGHLIKESDPEFFGSVGDGVSEERVNELFEQDFNNTVAECNALYGESEFSLFPEEVQEILVNMMFNMGRTRLSKFKKMNVALIHSDWKEAAKEGRDSLWYRQVTKRAERLMSRLENVS